MYDEAIMARFTAYCQTHPEWFTTQYLALIEAMIALDDPAPGQQAWTLLLDRFVERESKPGDGEDHPTGPVGWKPRFV